MINTKGEWIYTKSIEEDAKRLALLHDVIASIYTPSMTPEEASKRVKKDLYMVK